MYPQRVGSKIQTTALYACLDFLNDIEPKEREIAEDEEDEEEEDSSGAEGSDREADTWMTPNPNYD
eukprot:TRINITY_DN261_c0_g1_i2.p2 TRINITY_DN261_c0_g1~~TRINITY_DN261_c0_g1_i2.p2  ORF type:complete len:66 (-),score=28.70 TRINITY_DN261_c0_g1_i2:109-306(-)